MVSNAFTKQKHYVLRGIALAGLLLPVSAFALLEPTLQRLSGCYEPFTKTGADINKSSPNGTFFINEFRKESHSTDAQMLKQNDLSGFISIGKLYRTSPPIQDGSALVFTGNMYKRHASVLENIFSRSNDKMFYEVKHQTRRYLIFQAYLNLGVDHHCN